MVKIMGISMISSTSNFLPTQLSELFAWWRSDNVIIDIGISTVIDKSGNSRDLFQGTAAQPTLTTSDSQYNGKPSINSDGTQWLATVSNHNMGGQFTMFGVMKSTTTGRVMFSTGADGVTGGITTIYNDNVIGGAGVSLYYSRGAGIETADLGSDWAVKSVPHTYTFTYDGTTTTVPGTQVRDNGVNIGGTYAGTLQNQAVDAQLSVGSNTDGGVGSGINPFVGSWTEWLIYNRVLSSNEINLVETYLRTRYRHY